MTLTNLLLPVFTIRLLQVSLTGDNGHSDLLFRFDQRKCSGKPMTRAQREDLLVGLISESVDRDSGAGIPCSCFTRGGSPLPDDRHNSCPLSRRSRVEWRRHVHCLRGGRSATRPRRRPSDSSKTFPVRAGKQVSRLRRSIRICGCSRYARNDDGKLK
jgi:hypothetical protein